MVVVKADCLVAAKAEPTVEATAELKAATMVGDLVEQWAAGLVAGKAGLLVDWWAGLMVGTWVCGTAAKSVARLAVESDDKWVAWQAVWLVDPLVAASADSMVAASAGWWALLWVAPMVALKVVA